MQREKRIMIVGSHTITGLDRKVKMMISRLCDDGWHILVGDHSGLDAALQEYLMDMHTDWVQVYTARPQPQHNLDRWPVCRPPREGPWSGAPRHLQNTLSMTVAADCGLILWDARSMGTYFVTASLIEQGKTVRVYLPERGVSHTLRGPEDLEKLLRTYVFPK